MNIYVQGRYEYSPPPFCRQGNKLTSRDQNEPRPFSSKLRVLFHGTQPVRSLLWRSGHISVSRLYAAMQRRLFETSLAASGCVELPGFRVGTTRGGERKGEDIRADTVPSALDWDLTRKASWEGSSAPVLAEAVHRGRCPTWGEPDDVLGTEFSIVDPKQIGNRIFRQRNGFVWKQQRIVTQDMQPNSKPQEAQPRRGNFSRRILES